MEQMEALVRQIEQIKGLVKQIESLKTFYNASQAEIVSKSGVSSATVSKTLSGKYYGMQLQVLIALADALNADVVLKPRDPRFIEHLKKLLPDIPIEEAREVAPPGPNLPHVQAVAE